MYKRPRQHGVAIRVFSIMNLGDSLGCFFFFEGNFWEKECLSTSFFTGRSILNLISVLERTDLFQKKHRQRWLIGGSPILPAELKPSGKQTHFLSACSYWVGIPIPKQVEPAVSNGWLGLFSSNSNHFFFAHKDSNRKNSTSNWENS